MKKYQIFLLTALFFTLIACQDLKRDKQISEITKLEERVEKVQIENDKKFDRNIGKIIASVMDVEFRIRRNYFSDTIDNALADKVNKYKMIRKNLRPVGKMFGQLQKGTEEELKTLKSLKTDIQNGAGDESKYDENIKFETDKVIQLESILKDMLDNQKVCLDNYALLHNELYAFSFELVKKNTHTKNK
jgi:hypothetical protein